MCVCMCIQRGGEGERERHRGRDTESGVSKRRILLSNSAGKDIADGHTWNAHSRLNAIQIGGNHIFSFAVSWETSLKVHTFGHSENVPEKGSHSLPLLSSCSCSGCLMTKQCHRRKPLQLICSICRASARPSAGSSGVYHLSLS